MRFKRKKDNDDIINRIKEINKLKNELNIELEQLREKCPHNNKKIGYLLSTLGAVDISEICIDCGKILGPVTELNMRNI